MSAEPSSFSDVARALLGEPTTVVGLTVLAVTVVAVAVAGALRSRADRPSQTAREV